VLFRSYYDNVYRFTSSTLNNVNNLQTTYDAMGNITSKTDPDQTLTATWNYDPNHLHALLNTGSGSDSFTYDANGNMTYRNASVQHVGPGSITWTSYNQPSVITQSSQITLGYNQDHERYYSLDSNGPEKTYYVGGLLEKVNKNGGTLWDWRHYVYIGSEPVAIVSRTTGSPTTIRYVLKDYLGSVHALLDNTGSVLVKESFRPFGIERNSADWKSTTTTTDQVNIVNISRRTFTFQTEFGIPGGPGMGLIDLNGRMHDAFIGRLLSADPTIPDPTNTQSYNRYSYVNNNPLSDIDPTGFDAADPNRDGASSGLWDFASLGQESSCSGACDLSTSLGQNSVSEGGEETIQPTVNVFNGSQQGPGTFLGNFYWNGGGWSWDSAGSPSSALSASTGPSIGLSQGNLREPQAPDGSSRDPASRSTTPPGKPPGNQDQLQQVTVTATKSTCSSGPSYLDRYLNFVSDNAINVGPYAGALLGGVWPKSLAPATGGTGPLLGSTNPLTSVPRAFGIPGAGSSIVRAGSATIGVATVGIGFYDATIELEGFLYAIPSQGSGSSSSCSQGP